MKKIRFFTMVMLILAVALQIAGCGLNEKEPIDGTPDPISGLIYSIDDNVILVVGNISDVNIPRNEWFEAGKRAVYFTITEDTKIEHEGDPAALNRLARGQKVDVWHDGFLAESYPEQGSAVRIVIVEDSVAEEYQTDSGRFIGLAENNLIEIKISGVPDEQPSRLYRLNEAARKVFENLALEAEEEIIFRYFPDEETDGEIFDLDRIIN